MCGACVGVIGQLVKAGSLFLHVGPGDGIQIIRRDGKPLYPPNIPLAHPWHFSLLALASLFSQGISIGYSITRFVSPVRET